jgi:uncharacterized protein
MPLSAFWERPSKSRSRPPPADGKANEACIEFFAKLLNVPRSSITIAAGQTSRNKVIRVTGLSANEVGKRLGLGSPS